MIRSRTVTGSEKNLRGLALLAVLSAALYAGLAGLGDLRLHLPLYLTTHALLVAGMLAARRAVRGGGPRALRLSLWTALAFRLIAAVAEPSLSDDVYRYVWDGRVQIQGIHPYRYAPDDPALAPLRNEDWRRINHRELKTIYPPLSEMAFCALAATGAGVRGFKLAMGILDFGVVLALGSLLKRRAIELDRLVLYSWNPVAVLETAGSGHCEPLGVMLVLLAAGWIARGRRSLSALAQAAAVQAKLLPLVLLPAYVRHLRGRDILLLATAVAVLAVPYALAGPALGAGTFDYARRWEGNAFLFAGVRAVVDGLDAAPVLTRVLESAQTRLGGRFLPWPWLYEHVWPGDIARLAVLLLALAWVVGVARARFEDFERESFLVLGGILLLSPTLHPWYLLWVLPFAALFVSRGFILLAALVPLAYTAGEAGVPWAIRCMEFLPPLLLLAWDGARSRTVRRSMGAPPVLC